MQSVTKCVRPCTTAIIRSCFSGVVMVHRAPSLLKIPTSSCRAASPILVGQTMMVWLFNELTVGPNIGWSPTTSAADFSIASTGFTLSDVKSQRTWPGFMTGAIRLMTRTVLRTGTETMTRSHCSARSVSESAVLLPLTSTSYPARLKTGTNSCPIFPVPPIMPAFMITSRGWSQ